MFSLLTTNNMLAHVPVVVAVLSSNCVIWYESTLFPLKPFFFCEYTNYIVLFFYTNVCGLIHFFLIFHSRVIICEIVAFATFSCLDKKHLSFCPVKGVGLNWHLYLLILYFIWVLPSLWFTRKKLIFSSQKVYISHTFHVR